MAEEEEKKNILFIVGLFEGHITSTIKLVEDLVSLGYNVVLYLLDEFAERYKNTGAKSIVFSIEPPDLSLDVKTLSDLIQIRSFEFILAQAQKDQGKYDYLLVDSIYDGKEINKIIKASAVISIHTLQYVYFPDDFIKQVDEGMRQLITPLNKKYNINMKADYEILSHPHSDYNLILTSKEFQSPKIKLDNSFYFIGPSSFEERPIDKSFPFKKDLNKKLIYISLGTVFTDNLYFFKMCINAFGFSKEFQLIISVGKKFDIKIFGNLPENVYIYNFVPQQKIFKEADIFISHGGLNSINERLLLCKKPIIIVPQFADQFSNAEQIELFGAGIALKKETINENILKNAVNSIIAEEEKYNKGVLKLVKTFEKAREERKSILKKILV